MAIAEFDVYGNLKPYDIILLDIDNVKEEFVTAGGIDLAEVDHNTMQSKLAPGLYFAGEVLNVDGVTGGFNFQNAWTTGYLAARAIAGGH